MSNTVITFLIETTIYTALNKVHLHIKIFHSLPDKKKCLTQVSGVEQLLFSNVFVNKIYLQTLRKINVKVLQFFRRVSGMLTL